MTQLELPKYEITKSKDFSSFLVVWCPREDCPSFSERPFLVHANTWYKKRMSSVSTKDGKPVVIRGRQCPYCHKVSEPPPRTRIG